VLAFSDLQADISAELIRAGCAVLCTNPRSIEEVLDAILTVGGALGLAARAEELVLDMRDEIRQVREFSSVWPHRPRVYFEEWPEPPIAGIRWVSEMIELAGGRDVFAELRQRRAAAERVVDPDEVVRRDPEIILASWCGRPLAMDALVARPGWDGIAAVKTGRVFEIDGADVLVPGPSLLRGLRTMHEIVQQALAR
jgi:iron complex transport system substrate-binding protein